MNFPVWYLGLIGLLFDLAGALIVLAPDWGALDNSLKRVGYKLSVISFIPILGYPIRKLDIAYRMDVAHEKFFNQSQPLEQGDLGFEVLKSVLDDIAGDDVKYDIIAPPPKTDLSRADISRSRSPDLLEEMDEEFSWGGGQGISGYVPWNETKNEIERRMDNLMFKFGGGLLAIGFSLQIVTELIQNIVL